ncbi:MAG: hypothetical protein HYV96_00125 [Opitutae bacterium]|nr:hypothetical protein [Opitutae bacterium]
MEDAAATLLTVPSHDEKLDVGEHSDLIIIQPIQPANFGRLVEEPGLVERLREGIRGGECLRERVVGRIDSGRRHGNRIPVAQRVSDVAAVGRECGAIDAKGRKNLGEPLVGNGAVQTGEQSEHEHSGAHCGDSRTLR